MTLIKKSKNSLCVIILILTLILLSTIPSVAEIKSETGYKAFKGIATDTGAVVAWGITFRLDADYTTGSSAHSLDGIYASAIIDPRQTDWLGDGNLSAAVSETIDSGKKVTRMIAPSTDKFWTTPSEMHPKTAYVYFCKYGNPNKSVRYSVKEVGDYTFTASTAYIAKPNYSLTLILNGPK